MNILSSFNFFYKLNTERRVNRYWLNILFNETFNSHHSLLFLNKSKGGTSTKSILKINEPMNSEFVIFFTNKEVFYTKLKYSRVPQFDSASGASASFLSGMYGFMVSERFGFELVDSADFLFLILYITASVLIVALIGLLLNTDVKPLHAFKLVIRSFFKLI